jgi:exosortase/archaeosortase family protein
MKRVQKKSLKYQTQSTRIKTLIFLVKLLVLSLPILFIFNYDLYSLEKVIADISSNALNIIGVENTVFDTLNSEAGISPAVYLFSNGLVLRIDSACTGIRSAYLLFAVLFSSPLKLKRQIVFLATGLVLLFFVNIARIVSAAIISSTFGFYEVFDNLLWSISLNAAVALILLVYFKNYSWKI